jgi:hypothetical protein
MKNTFKQSSKRIAVNGENNLWCPLCDWHVTDSMASRRRLGVHLGNYHYEDVAYPLGVEPEMEEMK